MLSQSPCLKTACVYILISTPTTCPRQCPPHQDPLVGPGPHSHAAITTTSSRSNPASSASARNAALTARNGTFLQNLLERLPLRAGQIALLLDFVKKGHLVRVAKAAMAFIKAHRWEMLCSLATIVGIVLIINPVAAIGFGAMGPIAGTIAAGWQAAIGNVAAGSLFAFLQSVGMVHFVTIPILGVAACVSLGSDNGDKCLAVADDPQVVGKDMKLVASGGIWLKGSGAGTC
ncbi:hypothetical protein B0H14DRAFT_3134494 [Mycena olivaceomarginata]|nr:hypothetical protein B0H14DRAFT_3134494 [Mycena olivaceomarginata]